MPFPLTITVARPADWPDVTRWTFAHQPPETALRSADILVGLLVGGQIPPAGVLLASRNSIPVGGIVVHDWPGGSAVVMLPGGESDAVRDALVVATMNRFPAADITLGQCFVDPPDEPRATVLLRCGFRAVTTLVQMAMEDPIFPPPNAAVRFVPYSHAIASTFADTLLATYRDSFDVPEANPDRTAAETVAGYWVGQPNPPRWWLAVVAEKPVGVLLLSDVSSVREVAYLGVVPEARRRGVGAALVRKAMEERAAVVTVDERNAPARKLYEAAGFREMWRQRAYLWRASGFAADLIQTQ